MVHAALHITQRYIWATLLEPLPEGLQLRTAAAYRLEQSFTPEHLRACLRELLHGDGAVEAISVAVSPELAAQVHQFTLEEGDEQLERLLELVDEELHALFDYDPQRYRSVWFPVGRERRWLFGAVFRRREWEQLQHELERVCPQVRLLPELALFPSAWKYNYPEHQRETAVVVQLQQPFVDIAAVEGEELVDLRTVRLGESLTAEQLGAQVAERLVRLFELEGFPWGRYILLCGTELRRGVLEAFRRKLAEGWRGEQPEILRLNAFRMLFAPEAESVREFAARTAHLFWGCVGAAVAKSLPILQR